MVICGHRCSRPPAAAGTTRLAVSYVSSPQTPDVVNSPRPGAGPALRPPDLCDPWLRIEPYGVMTPPLAGQAGHGRTAVVRNQPVRIVDGHFKGGYTGLFELICPSCGDHPYVDYTEVPPQLQRLRGPRALQEALAAYHKHIGQSPDPDGNGAGSLGPVLRRKARGPCRRPRPQRLAAGVSWII